MATHEIKVTIEGISPLLLNRFTDRAQMSATSGTRSSINTESSIAPREQAEERLYTMDDGTLIIPQPNMARCFIDAGKYFKVGKSKVTTQKSSILAAGMFVTPIAIPLVSDGGWKVDTRPVRIPSTGGRILCHRPCFDDWLLDFEVEIDTDILKPKLFREIVDAAGKQIGLGDFRPDTKGPFGRFVVTNWETND